MASRKSGESSADKGRVKVRVIEFEMDGSNATLRDSIRDIVGAIGRGQVVVKQTNTALPPLSESGSGADAVSGDGEDRAEMGDSSGELEGDGTAAERPARSRSRTFRSPQILEIDLTTGDQPLKAFVQETAPDSEATKYIVIAHWYKANRNINEVNGDHIHTAYRHLNWQTPDDVSSPLRYLKARPYNYFNKGAQKGYYAINHIGENKVMELLQKGGKSA